MPTATDALTAVRRCCLEALAPVAHDEVAWSAPAGSLEWSCRETAAHLVDGLFSYAIQLAATAGEEGSAWLPFAPLEVLTEARARHLVGALSAVSAMLVDVVGRSDEDLTASDGLVELRPSEWAVRGGFELLVHSHDILSGLGQSWRPPSELCQWVLGGEQLWMLDRQRADGVADPWEALLRGSGRPEAGWTEPP